MGKLIAFGLAGCAMAFVAGSLSTQPGPRLTRERTGRRRSTGKLRRVVVVGAGFAGLTAAAKLAGRPGIDLTLIDAQNHHLFQPLLYQVATAALSPADIASPVRGILPASPEMHVLMERVTGVDTVRRVVQCDQIEVPYDELVIATGSRPSYFGHSDWAEIAPSLKTLEDALALRRKILEAFELATTASPVEHDRLMTFVLIGGGPTGVEMAGSIAELSRDMLTRDFQLPRSEARIVLVEAGDRLLSGFERHLSDYAADALAKMGVEVRLGAEVKQIEEGKVHLAHEVIEAGCVIWTAGTEATPVAAWLGRPAAKGGLVEVGPDLRVPGLPEVAVIGDAALTLRADGKKLPALAPVAKQQGAFIAKSILARMKGRPGVRRFRYRDYGTLATIGRNKAVASFGPAHLTGFVAWAGWAVAHVFFLISFRNRVMVSAQWLFAYATNQRGSRLIIGTEHDRQEARRVNGEAAGDSDNKKARVA